MNSENKMLAYLNLPYFTRQDELTREITNLVVAILNIVVIAFPAKLHHRRLYV